MVRPNGDLHSRSIFPSPVRVSILFARTMKDTRHRASMPRRDWEYFYAALNGSDYLVMDPYSYVLYKHLVEDFLRHASKWQAYRKEVPAEFGIHHFYFLKASTLFRDTE